MTLSFSKRVNEQDSRRKYFSHVAIRAIVLAILGVLLWQQPGGAHPEWGFYSVLYRIGFSYFFAALIMMSTNIRGQILWTFGLLAGYWIMMRFIPVPGYGIGDYSEAGNLKTYLGELVSRKISPDFRNVLNISLIPTVANALLGVLAGHWLLSPNNQLRKAAGLFAGGIASLILSFLISLDFPIAKNMWSTSFTFLTCGISAVLLSAFYWLIDVIGHRGWAFFLVVVGVNSITIYVAGFLLKFGSVANVFVGGFNFGNAQSFMHASVAGLIKWLFLYYLYRQRVFLKI